MTRVKWVAIHTPSIRDIGFMPARKKRDDMIIIDKEKCTMCT
jgi:hypothetical protein